MKFSLALLLLSAATAGAADDEALGLLPPHARIVFGMHVRGVLDSTLAQSLATEIQGATADWQKIISLGGFDLLHDLDEVLLASTGEGKEAPVLLIVRGKFDKARLTATASPYHDVPIVNGEQKAGAYAILDDSTLLAGDVEEVKAAIDRRGASSALDPALTTRIADYRRRYDLWGVADTPAALAHRISGAGANQSLDSIDRFQFGLGLQHGLEMAAEVHARTGEDARQLASSLRLVEAMMKASQPKSSSARLTIEMQEATLKIAFAISEEELKAAIKKQREKTRASAAPASPTAPAPVASTKRQIQSTDGGTSVLTLPGRR